MIDEIRLFGIPGSEYLESSLQDAYERYIDPCFDEKSEWEIEEWTVVDPRSQMPQVEMIAEYVAEWIADDVMFEEAYESWEKALSHPEVVEALGKAFDLAATKVTFWMADKRVATHKVTFDGEEPLVNGQPLYRKVES